MREVGSTLGILGVIGVVMGILTALTVTPAFISSGLALGEVALTVAFWWGLAALLLLASIASGIASWGSSTE